MIWSILLSTLANASTPEDISRWVRSRPTPPGQLTEMTRYGLDDGYASSLSRWVRGQLARQAALAVSRFQQGQCSETSKLRVLSPGFAGLSGSNSSDFEGSVFRLETTGCLDVPDARTAEQTYHSAAFRTAEMPNLDHVTLSDDQVCLKSGAVPGIIAATDFCLSSSRFDADGLIVTHNALSTNHTANGAAPVYYREEIIVFAQLDDGVGVFRMIWTRGQDIGTAGRTILQRTASSSQSRIYRSLEAWANR